MAYAYKITPIGFTLDKSENPPLAVIRMFPEQDWLAVTVGDGFYEVLFQERKTPAVTYSHLEVTEELV